MPHQVITYEHDIIEVCEQNSCKECSFCNNEDSTCTKKCSKKHFEKIKKLIDDNLIEGLKIERENGREIIKCSKYTAYFLIDEVEFCILPKIDKEDNDTSKKIFYNLLNSTEKFNDYKALSESATELSSRELFRELIISRFCNMMDELFKKGIKKFYSLEEDNLPYLKGKIKFSENIKRNIISKEKFYVEYDEFTENIPENRILKTACCHILKKSKSEENKKRLRRYIKEFGNIEESKNIIKDFAKIQTNRLYKHYDEPLNYAEVFLNDKYFWPRKGRRKFPAILFSLNDLFENYIEKLLKHYEKELNFSYKKQFSGQNYLITHKIDKENNEIKEIEENLFATKMDFVLNDKEKKNYVILDAKYKIINFNKNMELAQEEDNAQKEEQGKYKENYDITQADLYQIYTYSKLIRKNCKEEKVEKTEEQKEENVTTALLYPRTNKFDEVQTFKFFDGTIIKFIPIALDVEEKEIYEGNKMLKVNISKLLFPVLSK